MRISPILLAVSCLAALAAAAVAPTVKAEGDADAQLASRLAALRGELEDLSTQLSDKSEEVRDDLRTYSRQKVELEMEVQREQTRLQKMRAAVATTQAETEKKKAAHQSLEPAFAQQVATVRSYVSSTLPFRTRERLAELDSIEQQVKANLLTPQRAFTRLWSFVEDELRLTRESGLYRQTIKTAEREQLADVVRIGMVMLFFRTGDDSFGYAVRTANGWSYRTEQDPENRKRILALFQDFQKQINVGFFELPNALAVGGAK
jgi:CII-binding regulator of phage lambda lysogenization HflD